MYDSTNRYGRKDAGYGYLTHWCLDNNIPTRLYKSLQRDCPVSAGLVDGYLKSVATGATEVRNIGDKSRALLMEILYGVKDANVQVWQKKRLEYFTTIGTCGAHDCRFLWDMNQPGVASQWCVLQSVNIGAGGACESYDPQSSSEV